ncbi:MAG: hypothetical protein ACOH5I_11865 [Oligoflexus sp.]
MGAKGKTQYKIPPIPIFRKLFRKGSLFVCGICRSEYHSRVDGNNCLNFCWFELKNLNSVFVLRHPKRGWLYRCQFCARDHASETAAQLCAHNCREKNDQIHIHEQLLNELPLSDHRPQPLILIRSPKEIVKKTPPAKKRKPTKQELPQILVTPTHRDDLSTVVPTTEPVIDEPSVLMPSRKLKEEDDDKIDLLVHADKTHSIPDSKFENHEQNAAANSAWSLSPIGYRCRICHVIYDTSYEAESCHAEHMEQQSAATEIDLDS